MACPTSQFTFNERYLKICLAYTGSATQSMEQLQQQLNKTLHTKSYHQQQIRDCDDKIESLKCQIFDVCEHKWVRDTADRCEHTTWICEACGLDRRFSYKRV